ncbi:MAG: VWA domain-containing protein [Treponema sp.]|nr:VWA domain-containing protein [Treponema sp.]
MNFSIAHPKCLYALLLLIPYVAYMMSRYAKIVKTLGKEKALNKNFSVLTRYRSSFLLRTFLRVAAWIMIVCAMSGISWGTSFVPVQKSGRAVSMVFDISYSMEAEDGPGGITRREAASSYARMLLDSIGNTSVSVVLAKGDGVVAVPQTEDKEAVLSILESLSPRLMTSKGTSLGKGIEAAISAFPSQSSQASFIWVFTDGEETDSSLASSLMSAVKFGIPVVIIGFGSDRETTVLAGDMETEIKTALRTENVLAAIESVKKKTLTQSGSRLMPELAFVDSSETGSATKILASLKKNLDGTPISLSEEYDDEATVVYELQSVDRHNLFILLALVFIVLSFIFGELNISMYRSVINKVKAAAAASSMIFLFTGCSPQTMHDGIKILEGHMEWNRENYQKAVGNFLEVEEASENRGDVSIQQYALYGLATSYLMQNENSFAKKRYEEINPDAPDNIKFSVLYNMGILAHRNGDYKGAVDYFKQALLVKSSDVNAKINLELSLKEYESHSGSQNQDMSQENQNTDNSSVMENAFYSRIRENEQNQWKNQQQKSEGSALDY